MNNILLSRLLCGLLFSLVGCQERIDTPLVASEACAAGQPPIKTVTDVEGRLFFDATLHQYCIYRALPGTIDRVDIGVLCGTLPDALQQVNSKVVFSGTYKSFDQAQPVAPVGTEYYYLEVTRGKVETNKE